MKKIDATAGQFQRSVGNYPKVLGGFGKSLVAAFGIGGVATLFAKGVRSSIEVIKEFDQSLANLDSIANPTSGQLEALKEQALQLGATTAFSATQVLQLQTELAKLGFSTQEITESSKAIIDFSIATGSEVPRAAAVAGAAIRAFGLDASQANDVVSTLAVATTKSALDFGKIETALSIVAPVAKAANISLEQTTSQLGVLADRGLDASTAGTSLRNIYLDLAKKGLTWNSAMEEINNSTDKLNTSSELFGKRGATTALILAENADAAKLLETGITGVNAELEIMTSKQLNTLQGQLTLLESAWSGFILSIESGDGALSNFAKDVTGTFNNVLSELTYFNEGRVSLSDLLFKSGSLDEIKEADKTIEEFETNTRKSIKKLSELEALGRGGIVSDFVKVYESAGFAAEESAKKAERFFLSIKDGLKKNNSESSKTISSELDGVKNAYEATLSEITKINKKNAKSIKEEITIDAGSLNALKSKISGLNNEIGNTSDKNVIADKLQEIAGYQSELDSLTSKIKETKSAIEEAKRLQGVQAEQRETQNNPLSIPSLEKDLELSVTLPESEAEKIKKGLEDKLGEVDFSVLEDKIKETLRIKEEVQQNLTAARDAAIDGLGGALLTGIENQKKQIDEETDYRLERLNEETQARLEAAEGNAALTAQIEQESEAKRIEIQKEAFVSRQKLAIKEALINGAIAAIKALANTILPFPISLTALIPVAAQTAASVAAIKSQKFQKGGIVEGESHKKGGEKFKVKSTGQVVELEGGEGVINKKSMQSGKKMSVSGTPSQIASKINSIDNYGVEFSPGAIIRKFKEGGLNSSTPNIDIGPMLRIDSKSMANAVAEAVRTEMSKAVSNLSFDLPESIKKSIKDSAPDIGKAVGDSTGNAIRIANRENLSEESRKQRSRI